jgi:transposase
MKVIGIDVSKPHLDVAVLDENGSVLQEERIANKAAALRKFLRSKVGAPLNKGGALVCLEPTGHYSSVAVHALLKMKVPVWLAHPTDIQRSMGMLRGKNDKVDARRIAQYAFRFQDKARLLDERYVGFAQIKELLSTRDALVRDLGAQRARKSDNLLYMGKEAKACVSKCIERIMGALERSIADIQRQVEHLIKGDEHVAAKHQLVMSVTGVGPVLANEFIVATRGFTRFDNPRQFECYIGVAPFQYSSGISTVGRGRVSHRANKRLKQLFHLAALSAIRVKGDLQDYYYRKLAQGKKPMTVLNALRAKIIHHIWAVLTSGQPYKPFLHMS